MAKVLSPLRSACFLAYSLILATVVASDPASVHQVLIDGIPFTIPDGCTLEQITEPKLCTWPIVATWDPQGNLVVAESVWTREPVRKQLETRPHRIVRLIDTDRDGRCDRRQVIAESLSFPEGVLCVGNDILVSAPPEIWKLTDADGDGVCESREVWFDGQTLTNCANDLHGPWLGPDGWIYWAKAAFAQQTHEILPRGQFTSTASHLYRRHPRGGPIEPVMTGGMDNLVDVAWHPSGERFFCATFLHHPADGIRDGIGHAMVGAVFGKPHQVLDGHPKTGPLMKPLVEMGPAAPAGLLYVDSLQEKLASRMRPTQGEDLAGYLAVAQFNLHKVSVHPLYTRPDSAGYTSASIDLVSSPRIDFHPVDALLDRDGSLIIVDTGGWYDLCCPSSGTDQRVALGGIYRLRGATVDRRDDGAQHSPETQILAIQDIAQRLVEDPVHEASWRQIDESLRSESVDARLAALNLISLYRHRDSRDAVRYCLDRYAFGRSINIRTARLAAECLGRIGLERRTETGADDFAALFRLIDSYPSDRSIQHAVILALMAGDGFEIVRAGLEQASLPVRSACAIALDQRQALREEDAQAICRLASSDDSRASSVATDILQRHPEWSDSAVPWLADRFLHGSDPEIESLAPILARWSGQTSVQLLVQKCLDQAPSLGAIQQRCLMQTLESSNDRVLPGPWAEPLSRWITAADADHPLAELVTKLTLGEYSAVIAESLQQQIAKRDSDVPRGWLVWSRGLPTGATLTTDRERVLVAECLEGPPDVRKLALGTLQRIQLTDRTAAVELIRGLDRLGPLELPQGLEGLFRFNHPEIDREVLERIATIDGAKALNIDRTISLLRNRDPGVIESWRTTLEKLQQPSADIAAVVDRWMADLPAGDAKQGFHVFRSDKAACSACHRIGYVGGNVGPILSQIGRTRSRRDLIEAIVFPSARLEQSYRSTKLRTVDGEVINGLIVAETASSITLQVTADRRVTVQRGEIEESEPSSVSIMPAGLDQQLTRQEMADLIAFLENAK
jgi:putative heme-binding domain-containing protein